MQFDFIDINRYEISSILNKIQEDILKGDTMTDDINNAIKIVTNELVDSLKERIENLSIREGWTFDHR